LTSEKIQAIAQGSYRSKSEGEIAGSGYVVACLEAALWCFSRTADFREAILCATNLGDDADTTAAVCGPITGAHYGESGIPKNWLDRLACCDDTGALADTLLQHGEVKEYELANG
jgi:ADP-ribosyl-[dinitrogen reductase] hydrolase